MQVFLYLGNKPSCGQAIQAGITEGESGRSSCLALKQLWYRYVHGDSLLKRVAVTGKQAGLIRLPFRWSSYHWFYRLEEQAHKKIRLHLSIAVSLPSS